jgi:hypothetical protein
LCKYLNLLYLRAEKFDCLVRLKFYRGCKALGVGIHVMQLVLLIGPCLFTCSLKSSIKQYSLGEY